MVELPIVSDATARVLVVTSDFYFPPRGADDTDRIRGIEQLLRLGRQVKVFTKGFAYHDDHVQRAREQLGIDVVKLPYRFDPRASPTRRLSSALRRIISAGPVDSTAAEFASPDLIRAVEATLKDWRPQSVLLDGSATWPIGRIARKNGIRTVVRSLNFEPPHVLGENHRTPLAWLQAGTKLVNEVLTMRFADRVLAISPRDAAAYRRLGAREVAVLPLRGLPRLLRRPRAAIDRWPLNVFTMGSTYTVPHMVAGLRFILEMILPAAGQMFEHDFHLHIFGGKLPASYASRLPPGCTYHGYVDNIEAALGGMDIALMPSLFGGGMQQKVFEPLSRGIPTITHARGLAGYPFEHDVHALLASDGVSFVEQLRRLQSHALREDLSAASVALSRQLFSQDVLDGILSEVLA